MNFSWFALRLFETSWHHRKVYRHRVVPLWFNPARQVLAKWCSLVKHIAKVFALGNVPAPYRLVAFGVAKHVIKAFAFGDVPGIAMFATAFTGRQTTTTKDGMVINPIDRDPTL
jgi:hypothetical protein